jgi:CrcB protein
MILKHFLLVGLGGAMGSVLRFGLSQWLKPTQFPWATFTVNIAGSFLIGLVFAVSLRNASFEQHWRLFLASGICGGFTTFSAFSLEGLSLLQQQKIGMYLLYVSASILLGLGATWLGYILAK